MRQLYITNGQAFALVYSIDDRASFEEAQEIYQQIIEVKSPDEITVVLVGNKCDLDDRREVEMEEAMQAAKRMCNCHFVETSAKDGTNVADFFAALVMAVDRKTRGSSGGVTRRRATGKNMRRSFNKTGKRKEKSRSQPDLSTYSTDYFGLPARPVLTDESTKKRCVIM